MVCLPDPATSDASGIFMSTDLGSIYTYDIPHQSFHMQNSRSRVILTPAVIQADEGEGEGPTSLFIQAYA